MDTAKTKGEKLGLPDKPKGSGPDDKIQPTTLLLLFYTDIKCPETNYA